jgi:putative cell wall-binding protein
MKKLLMVLLAFLAVFTYIRALSDIETQTEIRDIPVEIVQ